METKYIRVGYCCRCGDCCKGDPFTPANNDLTIEQARDVDANIIDGCVYCPLVVEETTGEFTCTDRHNEYYLNGPNEFPTHPDQLKDYPNCTYRFIEVDGS